MNPRAYTYMDTHQHRLESVDPLKYVVTDPEIRNWPVLHAGSEHAGGRDVRVLVPEGSVYLQPNETRMFDTGLAAGSRLRVMSDCCSHAVARVRRAWCWATALV
ncbi:hypothetical protein [Xanthomonas phage JGB6]|nr:hypothetical protein [Xanthomonas phage JGB6]